MIRCTLLLVVLSLAFLPSLCLTAQVQDAGEEAAPASLPEGPEQPAQSDPAEPAPELRGAPTVTDTITVTATRSLERSIYDLPVSVSVLSREEIESSPATSSEELLREVAGVQLQLQNSGSGFPALPSVSIRGLGLGDNGTRALVLLDGLPMNGAFFGNVFWSRLPKQNVDRVEVVRGASSSLFGSYAMGGVIHLLSRPVPAATAGAFEGRFGSDETYQVNAFGAHRGDGYGLSLNANYFDTGGYFELAPEDRGAIDRRNAADALSLQGRWTANLGAGRTGTLRANYFDQDQDRGSLRSHTATEVWDIAAGLEALLSPRQKLKVDLYFLDERFQTDNIATVPRDTRMAEFVSNAHDTPAEDLGGSFYWTGQMAGKLESLTLGADYRSIEGKDDAEIFLADGSLFQTRVGSGEQESLGIFAEASLKVSDNLTVLTSVRQDFFRNTAGRDIVDGEATTFPDKEFEDFNLRLAARYQATDHLGLRGAAYSGFRAPTLAELYRAFGTSTFRGLPNSQLDPETLEGAELGLDIAVGSFSGQVNTFYNEVKDFIGGVAVAFFPVFTLQNFNIGRIETQGVELIGETRLGRSWHLAASYTYTDSEIAENIDDPEVVGNRVEGAPEHAASLKLGYTPPRGFAATLRGRFEAEQFQDATNTARLPPHTVIDLALSYPLRSGVEIYGSVENLFDESYIAGALGGLERLGAPRQVFGGARLSFQ